MEADALACTEHMDWEGRGLRFASPPPHAEEPDSDGSESDFSSEDGFEEADGAWEAQMAIERECKPRADYPARVQPAFDHAKRAEIVAWMLRVRRPAL